MSTETLPQTVQLPAGDYALIGQAANWKRMVENYSIDSHELYEAGADDLRAVKGIRKRLDDERARMKAPVLDAGRAIDSFFKAPISMLDEAASTINRAMIGYKQEQDRIIREQQRIAEAAAEAERQRLAEEARELAKAGRAEEAEQAEAMATVIVAPRAAVEAPKAAGVHTRTTYKAEVTDLAALIEFVASNHKTNPAVLHYLIPDLPLLNKLASALKENYAIPGTRAVPVESVVAR